MSIDVAVTTGLPTVSGTLLIDTAPAVAVTYDLAIVSGTLLIGTTMFGAVQMPAAVVKGAFALSGTVQLPLPEVVGTLLSGTISEAAVATKPITSAGVLIQEGYLTGALIVPAARVAAVLKTGNVGTGAVQLPNILVFARSLTGTVSSAAAVLPSFEFASIAYFDIDITAAIELPLFQAQSILYTETGTFNSWVLNSDNGLVTNYKQFPFVALGKLGTSFLGAAADGIYLLEGNDDAGQDIDATFKFGIGDFGDGLFAQVPDAYLGCVAAGNMELSTRIDGQQDEYVYLLKTRSEGVRPQRIKLGKGLRSKYWQFALSNIDGSDFEIDTLQLMERKLNKGVGR